MLLIILALFIVWPILGHVIGKQKGQAGMGLTLGLLLGPLGLIICCLLPDIRPKKRKYRAVPTSRRNMGDHDRLNPQSDTSDWLKNLN